MKSSLEGKRTMGVSGCTLVLCIRVVQPAQS